MRLSNSPHRTWAAFVPVALVLALVSVPSSGAAPDRRGTPSMPRAAR